MLKKLLVLLTLMSMILTVAVPVVYGYDAEKTTLNIDGGVLVIEGTHTPADGVNVELNFKSYIKSTNKDRYDPFMRITGDKVYRLAKGGFEASYEREICTLAKGETYHLTIVYKHSDVSGTESSYDLYVNGVNVGTATDFNNSYLRRLADFRGTNKSAFTVVHISDETSETYDMTRYDATISAANGNIVLDGSDKVSSSSVVFGGFSATLLDNMTVDVLKRNVIASNGATVSVVRGETALAEGELIATGDSIVVTSQNAKVVNKYAVTVNAPVEIIPCVHSEIYTIEDTTIKGVYEYTPVDTFMSYLNADEGWTMALKNGETEVLSGIVSEDMVLVANKGEEEQIYNIEISDKINTTVDSSENYIMSDLPQTISYFKNFTRGNVIIEMQSKVVDGYYTGGKFGSVYNNALWIADTADGVKFIMNTNAWNNADTAEKFKYLTDFEIGDDLFLTFVIRSYFDTELNDYKAQLDYYINNDYVSTCALGTIRSADWTNWRIPKNTTSSIFMVEDLDEYISSKNANKIKVEDGKVSAYFAGKSSDKLYLAVYSGNELESIQVANLSDFNFKADVLSIPDNTEGKIVKAFLWSSDLNPIDFKDFSEQTDALFDREFDS